MAGNAGREKNATEGNGNKNPYDTLESRAFWAPAIAKRNMFDISELWIPKFRIDRKMKVATYGSCFAQHIGRALRDRGFNWMIAETAPTGIKEENAKRFNYGVFSSRTGNIYTVSLLKQWVTWANGGSVPDEVWEKNGRYYDPFRPNIEPDGFETIEEMRQSREAAIEAFRATLTDSAVFVFTLGLTESWVNEQGGFEYPMCPGTVAGTFDEECHKFINQDYGFIRKTLSETIVLIRKLNPHLRFLLTVSPVPLTATMSGNHVLVATMESKSALRAVAGSICRQYSTVDYFPSYEIINATPFRGTFFEANQRSVNHAGVEHVMKTFFSGLNAKFPFAENAPKAKGKPAPKSNVLSREDAVCEEELLNAFAK